MVIKLCFLNMKKKWLYNFTNYYTSCIKTKIVLFITDNYRVKLFYKLRSFFYSQSIYEFCVCFIHSIFHNVLDNKLLKCLSQWILKSTTRVLLMLWLFLIYLSPLTKIICINTYIII